MLFSAVVLVLAAGFSSFCLSFCSAKSSVLFWAVLVLAAAAVLGCSSARGWIQLILLVILVARLWDSYFDAFVVRVCRWSNTGQKA